MKSIVSIIINFFEKISWVLLCLFAVVLFYRPVETGDIWWHLKAGQFIFNHKFVPLTDPFPFGSENTPWVLTQWLGSLIYYVLYKFTGLIGLKVFRAAILFVTVFIFIRHAIKKVPGLLVLLLSILLTYAIHTRPYLRPFLFNGIFIQVFLISLLKYSKNKEWTNVLPIILTAPFWINLHLGSFMYGVSLIALFLFTAIIARINNRKLKESSGEPWFGYLMLLAIYCGLFIFNPYGMHGALHPIKAILFEDYLNFGHLRTTISELQPPQLFSIHYIWTFPIMLLGLMTIYANRQDRFRNLILILCGFFMFLYGQRASIYFVLINLYLFVDSFEHFPKLKSIKWPRLRIVPILCFIVFLSIIIRQQYKKMVFSHGRGYHYCLLTQDYTAPITLLNELKIRKFNGAIFNDDTYGGFIMWHHYPEFQAFGDTRQINLKSSYFYSLILENPARYFPQISLYSNFRAVMLDANKEISRKALNYFQFRDDWILSKVTGDKVLFVDRRNTKSTYQDTLLREENNVGVYEKILRDHLNQKATHMIDYVYMEPVSTAITLFELGYKGAALKELLYSFKISNSPYQHEMAHLMLKNLNR